MTNKVWGVETTLEENSKYMVKKMEIKAGYCTSQHLHMEKDETFYVSKGTGHVILNDNVIELKEGSVVHIPHCSIHRTYAKTDLEIIESSTPHPFDIMRIVQGGKWC